MHVFLVKIVDRYVMRIRKILISCVKLDHVLYSINYGIQFNKYITVKVHFSVHEKIMRINQNRPLEKFIQFLFMCLNVACIINIWRNNVYAKQIYATAT